MMKNQDVSQILGQVPLFSSFQPGELDFILKKATLCTFNEQAIIFREHDPGSEFYLILKGQVEVRKSGERLAQLHAGQFFGEMALFDELLRSADVVAVEDTECLVLTSSMLHELIADHPEMALKMLSELTRRLRHTDQDSVAALERRVASRTRELSTLYEVTAVASESLDLQETMDSSLDRVLAALDTDMGAIGLLDPKLGKIRIGAQRGIPSEVVQKINAFEAGEGIGSWVVEHGVPLVIFDITRDHRVPTELQGSTAPAAYVGVPMRSKGKVLGVLGALRQVDKQFSVEEVALLASIADQVGVAIENAQLYEQAQSLAIFEERRRLARDLHDSVTQSIYSVTLFAEAARRLIGDRNIEQTQYYLEELRETALHSLKELRLLVYELRPSLLEEEGLIGALQQRLSTVEERAGVTTAFELPEEFEVPSKIETDLYYIAQEALNNSLKHSGAIAVSLNLELINGSINMRISDNGAGFDPESLREGGGIGLNSMRERTEGLNGSFSISSSLGEGTEVRVEIPLEVA
jgi:signal transduction histidine kinase